MREDKSTGGGDHPRAWCRDLCGPWQARGRRGLIGRSLLPLRDK